MLNTACDTDIDLALADLVGNLTRGKGTVRTGAKRGSYGGTYLRDGHETRGTETVNSGDTGAVISLLATCAQAVRLSPTHVCGIPA